MLFYVIYVMFYTACIYCKLPGSGRFGTHKHGAEDSAGRPGPRRPRVPKAQRPELSQARPNRPARRGIAAPPWARAPRSMAFYGRYYCAYISPP